MAAKRPTTRLSARTADRHALYEQSVQAPDAEIALLDRLYRRAYGRAPESFREDFCGTALLSSAWVRRGPARTALGVDLDEGVLDWGRRHNREPLGEAAERLTLLADDVRNPHPKVDVAAALNFSYFVFRERREMLRYFENARAGLNPEGIFVLDILGGPESQKVGEERIRHKGFIYAWDQADFNPIDHHYVCHIHFDFPDGTRMKKAFTYDWRLWGLMEIRDLLADAGFSRTDVYWEGTDQKTARGNGVFTLRKRVPNDEAWIAYVVAHP